MKTARPWFGLSDKNFLNTKQPVDVLYLDDLLQPGFGLAIDGRKQNTEFFRKHLKRRYDFQHRELFDNSVFNLVS